MLSGVCTFLKSSISNVLTGHFISRLERGIHTVCMCLNTRFLASNSFIRLQNLEELELTKWTNGWVFRLYSLALLLVGSFLLWTQYNLPSHLHGLYIYAFLCLEPK